MSEASGGLVVTSGWYGRPFAGEVVSGDLPLVFTLGDGGTRAVLIDVAGHGPEAASVAERVGGLGVLTSAASPTDVVHGLHGALRGGRGASVVVVDVDGEGRSCKLVAVGGILLRVFGPHAVEVVAQPGMVGEHLPTLRPTACALSHGDVVVIASDGVRRGGLYGLAPSKLLAPPARLARQVVEELGRPHDDATCIVLTVTG